mmetsp:Transcript_33758/g.87747  ORF Transcript_33758/g.87747 Transcript_33758/m.87747 type:complete len:181 (+) Transcript_33758:906-1448(+)
MCHDTSMLALSAHLGIDMPWPRYCGHMIFEALGETGSPPSHCRFLYEPTPFTPDQELHSVELPDDPRVVGFSSLPRGDVVLARLRSRCEDAEQTEVAEAIAGRGPWPTAAVVFRVVNIDALLRVLARDVLRFIRMQYLVFIDAQWAALKTALGKHPEGYEAEELLAVMKGWQAECGLVAG